MKNKKKNTKSSYNSKATRSSQHKLKDRKKPSEESLSGSGKSTSSSRIRQHEKNSSKMQARPPIKKKRKPWEKEEDELEIVPDSTSGHVSCKNVHNNEDDSTENPLYDEVKETRKLVMQQNRKKKKSGGFQSFGLSYKIYKGIIRKGYNIPTPIQRKTIPLIIEGKDVVAMARTGSGKTAAFLVPMFEKLKMHSVKPGVRAVILSPTRELALQTLKFSKELGKFTDLRAAVILGGDKIDDQFQSFHQNPDIIIATPGRLLHVLVEMALQLKSVEYIVFDEADRLFEMGFSEQLHEIINRLPEDRQTLLFSATLPKLLVEFAKAGLHDPTLIRLDTDIKLSEQLKLSFIKCNNDSKVPSLLYLLQNVIRPEEQTFVFVPTKHHVEYLNLIFLKAGISCTYIYSSLDQAARKIAIGKFQNKKVQVLIVTDLAARGIDIPLLDNVINYNFPFKPKLFVHRVGRVARAGRSGTAYSFVGSDESAYLLDLHLFLGRSVKFVDLNGQNKNENGLCGRVPQTIIDEYHDNLIQWEKGSVDIKNMTKVCSNAYKQYLKSRPVASHESIVRAKDLDRNESQIGHHPVFDVGPSAVDEDERLKFLNALRGFKTNTTVFEISTTKNNRAFDVMREKRARDGAKIEKTTAQGISSFLSTGSDDASFFDNEEENELNEVFQTIVSSKKRKRNNISSQTSKKKHVDIVDEENYLHYKPSDYQSEKGLGLGISFEKDIDGATLDLTGDDEKGLKRMHNQLKWDRKKKKYVHGEQMGSESKKKIKTESGTWIAASYKSSAYKDWKNRTKVEDKEEVEKDRLGKKSRNKFSVLGSKGRRWHVAGSQDVPGASARRNKFKTSRNEIKRPEQILKARRTKDKKEQQQRKAAGQKAARKKFTSQMSKKNKGRKS